MNRRCPHCGKQNRIPPKHLADVGRCGACKQRLPPLDEPLEVDVLAFDDITRNSRVPVLVDFWAPWCGPCKMAAPEVAAAARNLAGTAVVLKVNSDDHPQLSARFGVRSIPNFAVLVNGQLAWQQAGLLRHAELEAAVKGAM